MIASNKPSSGTLSRWLLIAVVIAMVAGVTLVIRHQRAQMETQGKFDKKSRATPVAVASVVKQDINVYLDALGTVTPRNAVTVKTRIDGQLMKLYFREGQFIKAGELLAEIDPRPYEVQLAQANGQLAKDKASLDNAQIDLERYKTLLGQDSIAKQQVDTQEALVRQYRGAVAVDQGQVDNAKLQLSYCRITAPISGRVGLRQVDPGNMVHASDTNGIVTITQMQPITALFSIPEDDLAAVTNRTRQGGAIAVEAFDRQKKNKLATGTLLTTDNQIDSTTGTIKLRAEFQNDQTVLFPNQFVNVRLLVNVQKEALLVPASAIQRGRNGDFMYVVKDGTVELRQVKTGVAEGELVAINSGVQAGESVVIDGVDKLKDGAKVKIATPDAPGKDNPQGPSGQGKHRHGNKRPAE